MAVVRVEGRRPAALKLLSPSSSTLCLSYTDRLWFVVYFVYIFITVLDCFCASMTTSTLLSAMSRCRS